MPIIISGDPTKSISLTGDQSKSIQASQVTATTSSDPPYIISGLEQSHWLASAAIVDGTGDVTSIPDESNVESLTMNPSSNAYPWSYSASGWTNNGKTLATIDVKGSGSGAFISNQWASKLSNYGGAFTTAWLYKYASSNRAMGWAIGAPSGTNAYFFGYGRSEYGWSIHRQSTGSNAIMLQNTSDSYGYKLVVMEYKGTTPSTPNDSSQFRLWINGTLVSLSSIAEFGERQTFAAAKFAVAGNTTGQLTEGAQKLAQFHIWKGALTDTQRNDVTAYLKSISGIA